MSGEKIDIETYSRVFKLVFKDFTRVIAVPFNEEQAATTTFIVGVYTLGFRNVWIGPVCEDNRLQTQLRVEVPNYGLEVRGVVDVPLYGESGIELRTAIAKKIVERAKRWQGIRVSLDLEVRLVEAKSLEELLVLADLNGVQNDR